MSKLSKLRKNPGMFLKDMILNVKKQPSNNIVKVEKKVSSLAQKKATPAKPTTKVCKNVMKTPQEYLKELTIFSSNFDVNSMLYREEKIWPYLRQHLWVQLYLLGLGKAQGRKLDPYRLQLGTAKHFPNYVRPKYQKLLDIKEIDELEQINIDFLFLTVVNASEQVLLSDGSIYNRITDPVYEAAANIGVAKKIELIKVRSDALYKCRKYKFKPDFIYPPSIFTSGYSYDINYHYKFEDVLKKCIPSIDCSLDGVNNMFDWELHTKAYYKQILKKYNPKILLVNGFHYHAPLLSAADELGILTVDIQHGIQIGWNPLYNNWNEMPSEGYSSVPRRFLVWGEKEKDHINSVFCSNQHKAIVGGYPWLTKQLDYLDKIESTILSKIQKYKKVVLVMLQNQKKFPELYLTLIKNSGDEILWVVRNHPKGSKFSRKDLNGIDGKNVLMGDYFDKISLARLFQVADICLSEGSTVAIEADHYGVINCLNGSEGYENYREEIDNGMFFHISSSAEFYAICDDDSLFTKESRTNSFSNVSIENVMSELLRSCNNSEGKE